MTTVFSFFGNSINLFYGSSHSITLSCILLCLFIKVLFIPMTNKYYNLPKITEELKPEIDEIERKNAKNPAKASKEISDLLVLKQYPFLSFAVYYALMMIIGVLISMAANRPDLYVESYNASFGNSFLFIEDMSEFTFAAMRRLLPGIAILKYLIIPLIASFLQYMQDIFMTNTTLVGKKWFDTPALFLTFAVCMIMPQVFSVYWLIYEIANCLHIFSNTKIKSSKVKTSK